MLHNLVIIGNPDSKRVNLLCDRLQDRVSQIRVVSYKLLLERHCQLKDLVTPDSIVRIESPERDFEVEKLLLRYGTPTTESQHMDFLSEAEISSLEFSKGRILNPNQWYRGWLAALELLRAQLTECPPHHCINSIDDIILMYDKTRTAELFRSNKIPVPKTLGDIDSFATLRDKMAESRCSAVFIKLRYGSGASGAVAYRTNGNNHVASTTTELARDGDDVILFNSRKIRTLDDVDEIALLINRLATFDLHVERWIPKAGLHGHVFDLRVLTIAEQPTHFVMRQSKSTFTNLHLLNSRADVERLIQEMGSAWQELLDTCRSVAGCFSNSLHNGIDVVVHPGFKQHTVLEVNAFGDLLNDVTCSRGHDPYTAELIAIEQLIAGKTSASET